MGSIKRNVRALQNKDPHVRQDAAKTLAILGDPRAVEPLINALEDAEWFVRLFAVMALEMFADARALEPLIKALTDEEGNVRWAAVTALGKLGEPAVEPLIRALSHEDYFVRRYAAEALGELGDPRAVEALTHALEDKDWDVHKLAERALENLGNPQAEDTVAQALEEKGVNSFGRNQRQIGGDIAYYGLTDWWLSSFTEEERSYIEKAFQPVSTGAGGVQQESRLTTGQTLSTSQSATGFLWGLASWFDKPDDRYIGLRILEHAEETMGSLSELALEEGEGSLDRNDKGTNILDAHFLYLGMIKIHYKQRDNIPGALEEAIQACEKQIAIAPQAARAFREEYRNSQQPNIPEHTGYKQLAIIRDKQSDYEAAIQLCEEAKAQGWAGDWDKRIARYRKKAGCR